MATPSSSPFRELGQEIFSTAPVVREGLPTDDYVRSTGYHVVRFHMPTFESSRAARYDDRDLREDIENQELLGPYERQILGHLLAAKQKLVILVGAAGSGKTTTLRYVLHH